MKKLAHVIITFCVLLILGWTLWIGLRKQQGKPETEAVADGEKAAAPAEEAAAEEFSVKLEKEKWESLALTMAAPEKTELKPQRVAFGRVLDPTPIVTLDGDLAAAEAVLTASRAENERTQRLLSVGENASRKVAEAAEAQFRSDEIRTDGLRRRSTLEWGALLPGEAGPRREFVDQLVKGESALIRVDLLAGDALAEMPHSARLVVLGREEQPVTTEAITPAADADPKTQAQGFLLRIDQPPFPLRPGMALTAWLELAETARAGFAVPRSAILRHDGRAWVYVQEEEKFVRKPVVLDTPLDKDKGWFIAGEGAEIKDTDQIVVTGAQSLLSEELKAQGGGAE